MNDVNPNTKFRKVWRALNTETVGHLTNDNHERYTREENEAALEKYKCDTIEGTIILKGARNVTTEALDSFDEICDSLPKEWLLPPLTQKHLDRPCEGEWWGQRDALALLQTKTRTNIELLPAIRKSDEIPQGHGEEEEQTSAVQGCLLRGERRNNLPTLRRRKR
jgi:aconitase A